MIVRELVEALSAAPPDAAVLFLAYGADLDKVAEVSAFFADDRHWTHEEGVCGTSRYEAYFGPIRQHFALPRHRMEADRHREQLKQGLLTWYDWAGVQSPHAHQ